MGNSEVGHTNIGAGRIVYQELTRISKEIEEENFFKNSVLLKTIENVKKNNSDLHLIGLVSDGGVHSHISHLFALLKLAKINNIENVYIHCITDGRDTPPNSSVEYLKQLEDYIKEIGVGEIATICGRYYAMDRDKRFDRVELAYNMLVMSQGNKFKTVQKAVENAYEAEEFDEFIKPIVITNENGEPIAKIKDKDSVIFFNFRPDRAREITDTLINKDFNGFERKQVIDNIDFVTMTCYDENFKNVSVAYKNEKINNTLGEYISKLGYTQLRIAETEKYAHVTFFFNGGEEKEYLNENRILIPSPKVATYDLEPAMSCEKITDKVLEAIEEEKYDLIIMNYANGDMVGHTGNLEKTVESLEILDKCVGRVITKIEEKKGLAIITADHGNAESMIDFENGQAITSHTTNDVFAILISEKKYKLREGRLSDISPTLIDLMGLEIPKEMTGESLVKI
jgi:2,3-bisphosphoglycerate-independent phosphoglycerate mutase